MYPKKIKYPYIIFVDFESVLYKIVMCKQDPVKTHLYKNEYWTSICYRATRKEELEEISRMGF